MRYTAPQEACDGRFRADHVKAATLSLATALTSPHEIGTATGIPLALMATIVLHGGQLVLGQRRFQRNVIRDASWTE